MVRYQIETVFDQTQPQFDLYLNRYGQI